MMAGALLPLLLALGAGDVMTRYTFPPTATGVGITPDITPPVGQLDDFSGSTDPNLYDGLIVTRKIEGEAGPEVETPRWLGEAIEVTRPLNALPTATLRVTHAEATDADGNRLRPGLLVNTGSDSAPMLRRVDEAISDDETLEVRTGRPEPELDAVIFRGSVRQISRQASTGKETALLCEHLASILRDDERYVIRGQMRFTRTLALLLAANQPIPDGTAPKLVTAAPCIYNPDGRGNCAKRLLTLPVVDEEAMTTTTHYAPVFMSEYDTSNAQPWSWARVFLDLFYRWRRAPDGQPGPLTEENLYERLSAIIIAEGWHLVNPATAGGATPADPWERALLGTPRNHAIDGMSGLDALRWTCAKAGLGYVIEDLIDPASGQAISGLRFVAPGATPDPLGERGRRVALKLASPAYTTRDKNWLQVEGDNDVTNLRLSTDYSQARNRALMLGKGNRYECTIELVPLWPAVSDWDVDPANTSAINTALSAATGDAWAAKYVRGVKGLEHYGARENTLAGRYWGVPDFRDMRELATGRAWAPWTDSGHPNTPIERYQPFDFSTLNMGDIPTANLAAVRARPIGPCVTGVDPNHPLPPLVEVSFDGGATWRHVQAGVRILRRTCGVFFEAPDLRDLADVAGVSFVEHYIRGNLRVRVTGTIEGDDQFELSAESPRSLSKRRRAMILNREFTQRYREDIGTPPDLFGGGNSRFRGNPNYAPLPLSNQDPFGEIERALLDGDRVRHRGGVTTPGLTFPYAFGGVQYGWRPGDEVTGIQAIDDPAHDVPLATRGNDEGHALIGAVTWRYDRGAGRGRAPASETQIVLEDPSSLRAAVAQA